MKKLLPLLLAITAAGLASCGPKKEKERIDYKNDTLEALIEKAGIHQETTRTLDTNPYKYGNGLTYEIYRTTGYDTDPNSAYYVDDMRVYSDTKFEQYYVYFLTLSFYDKDNGSMSVKYNWIDKSYQKATETDYKLICRSAMLNIAGIGEIQLWDVNAKSITVNYSNKTFAEEKFTVEKSNNSEEIDPKVGLFEGELETMIKSFDSFLEANNLALIF